MMRRAEIDKHTEDLIFKNKQDTENHIKIALAAGLQPFSMGIGQFWIGRMSEGDASEALHKTWETLLFAMLTGTYTAFEVLTEDLWKAVVAIRPRLEAQITTKERKDHKPGFRSTNKVRLLYSLTFRNDNADILTSLNSSEIESLSLLRNLIVHLAGNVDGEFQRRGANHASIAPLAALPVGTPIILTGFLVSKLIASSIKSGYDLMSACEKWLLKNP